jgi:hypothetical protein
MIGLNKPSRLATAHVDDDARQHGGKVDVSQPPARVVVIVRARSRSS